jgi:transcriptional regulator with XRE-family HTH domain
MSTRSRRSLHASAAAPADSPTLRRWELAARLRDLRLAAEMSVDEVAAALMCSAAKISRMETAGRGVQARDVRDLARLYGLPAHVRDELMSLAGEAKKPGWWQGYRILDEQTATFVGLESAAVEARQFVGLYLPALLQTPAYTHALLEGARPPGHLSADDIDQTVEIRMRRQQRVLAGELRLDVVIDEAALSRVVGGAGTMEGQLRQLETMANLPNVTICVIPFSTGPHPGVDGAFKHLRFEPGRLGDVVFVEGLLGGFLVDKSSNVERYLAMFDHLESVIALDPLDTVRWLAARTGDPAAEGSGASSGVP